MRLGKNEDRANNNSGSSPITTSFAYIRNEKELRRNVGPQLLESKQAKQNCLVHDLRRMRRENTRSKAPEATCWKRQRFSSQAGKK